jgi:hypothetical protein
VQVNDFDAFRTTKNFRSLTYIRIRVDIDFTKFALSNATLVKGVLDAGYTPPFNRWKFPSTFLKPDDSMKDPAFYPGELSSLSKITVLNAHPNSCIQKAADEKVICNSLNKFRAGKHTDDIGVSPAVGSPFHVPWVWSEMLLTVRQDGNLCLYAAGSQFPTHSWYVQGTRVLGQSELADKNFPHDGRSIIEKALRVFPALSTGASAQGPQVSAVESQMGAIPTHPCTLKGYGLPSLHRFRL